MRTIALLLHLPFLGSCTCKQNTQQNKSSITTAGVKQFRWVGVTTTPAYWWMYSQFGWLNVVRVIRVMQIT